MESEALNTPGIDFLPIPLKEDIKYWILSRLKSGKYSYKCLFPKDTGIICKLVPAGNILNMNIEYIGIFDYL
jgi:hypothetical protein